VVSKATTGSDVDLSTNTLAPSNMPFEQFCNIVAHQYSINVAYSKLCVAYQPAWLPQKSLWEELNCKPVYTQIMQKA
jgi:hypothetical protein